MHKTLLNWLAIFSLLAVFIATDALAQRTGGVKAKRTLAAPSNDADTETTLDIEEGAFLGYAGIGWGLQLVDGKWVHTFSVRGMWLYAETTALGIEFAGIDGYHPFEDSGRERIRQSYSTWSAVATRTLWPRKEIHYEYGLSFGRGTSSFELPSSEDSLPSEYDGSRIFYFLQPEANIVLNLTKYTKPFLGTRVFVPFAGRGNSEIKDSKLAGPSFIMGINVGNFTL